MGSHGQPWGLPIWADTAAPFAARDPSVAAASGASDRCPQSGLAATLWGQEMQKELHAEEGFLIRTAPELLHQP